MFYVLGVASRFSRPLTTPSQRVLGVLVEVVVGEGGVRGRAKRVGWGVEVSVRTGV